MRKLSKKEGAYVVKGYEIVYDGGIKTVQQVEINMPRGAAQ